MLVFEALLQLPELVSQLFARSDRVLSVCSVLQMAMLTVTVLATPNLGNSFTKAAQRIVGVMLGEQACG